MSLLLRRSSLLLPPWLTDPDARDFIRRVEAADGGPLENGVRLAYRDFMVGCKADGTWNAIKACCILAGARTLSGALVPLVGAAPTSFNFVAGDYNRKTGLVGDGSTKYLNSNRNNNADPVDNVHVSVFISAAPTVTSRAFLDAGAGASGATNLYTSNPATTYGSRLRSTFANHGAGGVGFYGTSRASSGSYIVRLGTANISANSASQTAFDGNINIFGSAAQPPSNPRLAFYSIGESLGLTLLDARVTGLVNAIAAAIP